MKNKRFLCREGCSAHRQQAAQQRLHGHAWQGARRHALPHARYHVRGVPIGALRPRRGGPAAGLSPVAQQRCSLTCQRPWQRMSCSSRPQSANQPEVVCSQSFTSIFCCYNFLQLLWSEGASALASSQQSYRAVHTAVAQLVSLQSGRAHCCRVGIVHAMSLLPYSAHFVGRMLHPW